MSNAHTADGGQLYSNQTQYLIRMPEQPFLPADKRDNFHVSYTHPSAVFTNPQLALYNRQIKTNASF
jgi:hypothetical protein